MAEKKEYPLGSAERAIYGIYGKLNGNTDEDIIRRYEQTCVDLEYQVTALSGADLKCSKCGKVTCKLWRQYQTMADHCDLMCRDCAEADQDVELTGDQIGWLVPAVPTWPATFWGYTSVPPGAIRWWKELSE